MDHSRKLFRKIFRAFGYEAAKEAIPAEDPGPKIASLIGKTVWIEMGMWANVSSSCVSAISFKLRGQTGIHANRGTLHIRFNTGVVYLYPGVTVEAAQALFQAGSVGSHFRSHFYNWPTRRRA